VSPATHHGTFTPREGAPWHPVLHPPHQEEDM